MPLVILEAFRQKTPAIVRNIGAIPEIINESGGGAIYNSTEDLRATLGQLMAEPEYRNKLGHNGYLASQQKWTTDAHLQQYFDLIHAVSARRSI